MGDGFYTSKDPTNSIKVLKEMLQKRKKTTKTTKYMGKATKHHVHVPDWVKSSFVIFDIRAL